MLERHWLKLLPSSFDKRRKDIPLKELVAQTAVLESLLASLEIGFVCGIAGLKPRDMLRSRDGLRGCTILSTPIEALRRPEALAWLGWGGGRGHLDDIGERIRSSVLLVAVAMSATLSMMLLSTLGGC